MKWPRAILASPFHRARRYAQRLRGARAAIYGSSLAAAIMLLALIWLLGMVTHLLTWGTLAEHLARGPSTPGDHRLAPPGWSWIVDEPVNSQPAVQQQHRRAQLAKLLVWGVLAVSLYALAVAVGRRVVQHVAGRVAAGLRIELERHAIRSGATELIGRSQLGVEQLFVENVEVIRQGLVAWWNTVPRAVTQLSLFAMFGLVLAFWTALAGMLLVCLDWLVLLRMGRWARQRAALWEDRAQRQTSSLLGALGQARLSASLLKDDLPGEPFSGRVEQLRLAETRSAITEGSLAIWLRLAVLATAVVLLALMALNVLSNPPRCSVADAVMLTALLICGYWPVHDLLTLRGALKKSERAARALFSYLDAETGVRSAAQALRLRPLVDQVELADATVRDRNGRKLLDRVSLRIPAVGRLAILSTDIESPLAIAGLLARLYDPSEGRVLIDGRDLRQVTLESVRAQIGLVLQQGLLSSATIHENLTCGDGRFTPPEVVEATKRVQAYGFIQRLPQAMNTLVGPGGTRLDPGEALQLGLARALLRDPRILVIEESIDEPDEKVCEALEGVISRWAQQRSVLVVARRLATLRHAHRVCVLHEGRLVADGNHAELLRTSELYRHLHYTRFNAFSRHDF